jgi:two-component system nitrate/nitrite response regulator NarL
MLLTCYAVTTLHLRKAFMSDKIRVVIMDDHQSIVDGYIYRLEKAPQIEVVGVANFGEELEPLLAKHPTDVALLDVNVPLSPTNSNPYPILHALPQLLQTYPDLSALIISMHAERSLIKALMEVGISGYILKDDHHTLRELGAVVVAVARGGIRFSQHALDLLLRYPASASGPDALSTRQLEALSLCAAYPNDSINELARHMILAASTMRNMLSDAYVKLGVNNRGAAIIKAREMGLITPIVSTTALKPGGAERTE